MKILQANKAEGPDIGEFNGYLFLRLVPILLLQHPRERSILFSTFLGKEEDEGKAVGIY